MKRNTKIILASASALAIGYVALRQSKLSYIKKTYGENKFSAMFSKQPANVNDYVCGDVDGWRENFPLKYPTNYESNYQKYYLGGLAMKYDGKLVLLPIERFIFGYANALKRCLENDCIQYKPYASVPALDIKGDLELTC